MKEVILNKEINNLGFSICTIIIYIYFVKEKDKFNYPEKNKFYTYQNFIF